MSTWPEVARDQWFPVALLRDVTSKPLRVELFGSPLVIVRIGVGIAAMEDRCPHRAFPLSKGKVTAAGLECAYHGWTFARDGRCALMPGAVDGIPLGGVRAVAYEVKEHDGIVWVSERGGRELPERVRAMRPDRRRFLWQTTWRAPIVDVLENFLDPLHTHNVHPGLVRRADRRQLVKATLDTVGDGVSID